MGNHFVVFYLLLTRMEAGNDDVKGNDLRDHFCATAH